MCGPVGGYTSGVWVAEADCESLCSSVSDRDRNLMVYMYLPEGEWFFSDRFLGWVPGSGQVMT